MRCAGLLFRDLRSAHLPKALLDSIRDGDAKLTQIALAHLLFARWILRDHPDRSQGLYPLWCAFVEQFPFARPVAPISLGLCGNDALLSPETADDLPAEPIDKITKGPRESTAWYPTEPQKVERWLSAMSAYDFKLPEAGGDLEELVDYCLREASPKWLTGFRNVARSNDERTFLTSMLPLAAVGHSMPLVRLQSQSCTDTTLLLGMFNSIPFDFVIRQKLGGINVTFGYIMQFPAIPPEQYTDGVKRYLVPRILELVCTTWELHAFLNQIWKEADAPLRQTIEQQWCENRTVTGGHNGPAPAWYTPPENACPFGPFKWDEDRRPAIRAELDAYFARLVGLSKDDLRYILDPEDVHGPGFPSETFRVLKDKEIARYGEYRTRRLVLEAWEQPSK
jgi:hypothetical protein